MVPIRCQLPVNSSRTGLSYVATANRSHFEVPKQGEAFASVERWIEDRFRVGRHLDGRMGVFQQAQSLSPPKDSILPNPLTKTLENQMAVM